ncbi:MAG: NosD domain-containing protein [Thermoleophilia bacterium]|nr:NosD domain-containing protein [Thermoleophilia bacterium]
MKTYRNAASKTGRFVFYLALMAGGAIFGAMSGVFVETAEAADEKHILNDSTGGDCSQIGIWSAQELTCTVTTDTLYEIYIDSDGITLDGNGHTLTGAGVHENNDAITVTGRTGVTVKNFILQHFNYGIHLISSHNSTVTNNISTANEAAGISLSHATGNTITGNTISNVNSDTGICIGYASSNNHLSANTITDADRGIYLHDLSNSNTITENTMSRNLNALTLYDSDSYNTITGNILTGNATAVHLHRSSNYNILSGNTISDNDSGLYMSDGASFNQVYQNNFINNSNQALVSGGSGNEFHLPFPAGGNYWSDYDTPDESCNDLDSDGNCDSPRFFNGGQDDLPAINQNAWVCTTPVLSLDLPGAAYWDNFADFQNQQLSIDWRITNNGGVVVRGLDLIANYHSGGVVTTSQLPISIGNLAANGGSKTVTVKSHVPVGLGSFRSTVFIEAEDSCGTSYYFPGRPPEV